ncbi:hypothetical protein EDF46_0451 [Frondihabitans sp. PhB188]|uniref:hypothetical protein n=1 Tax=Frondihabitans sp. PhB188 TaxID=2485200 RepID=UPI000F498F0E|nr:hypothetical protein [Frondihabitans sp. PhB188]ROQ41084.1 hypothetical protein EDF46_0451 [Frondihabitans sp. PhB188]
MWPSTGWPDRPWSESPELDAFLRGGRRIFELFGDALAVERRTYPESFFVLRDRDPSESADVEFELEAVLQGAHVAGVHLPPGFHRLAQELRDLLTVELVSAALGAVARTGAFDEAAVERATASVRAGDGRYVRHGR